MGSDSKPRRLLAPLERLLKVELGTQQKFSLAATLIFAAVSTFIVFFFPWAQERQMKKDLGRMSSGLAEMAAAGTETGLVFEDVRGVERALQGLLNLPGVAFLEVRRASGELFFSFQAEGEELPEEGLIVDPSADEEASTARDLGSLWVTSSPIRQGETVLGSLTLALSTAELQADVRRNRALCMAVAAATLVFGFTAFWALGSRIVKPLNRAVEAAGRIADGDLESRIEVSASGEPRQLLESMRSMVDSIRTVVRGMVDSSSRVSTIGEDLAGKGRDIVAGAEEQSTSTEQTSTSMQHILKSARHVAGNADQLRDRVSDVAATVEEASGTMRSVAKSSDELASSVEGTVSTVETMAKLILEVARNARQAGDASEEAVAEAQQGGRAVDETVSAMETLSESSEATAAVIRKLAENSQRITEIVDIIDDMADQTNLLALNAAIEAAHAGEQGKGFAVVAQEIRSLAVKSAKSTAEIVELIASVRQDTANAIEVSEVGSERARGGLPLAGQAGEALKRIVTTVRSANTMMQTIEETTSLQVQASEEMVKVFEDMRRMTQQIKTATREQAMGAERTMKAVEAMNLMTSEVSQAAAAQRQGSEEVGRALSDIARISLQQLEAATAIASRTEELGRHAESLRQLSERFRLP